MCATERSHAFRVRKASREDIPRIIELLRTSLGEQTTPKSAAFWTWKHLENPFGVSPVLLAEQNHELVGVRAFMRWSWRHRNEVRSAVRAVDTATHPGHRGAGVFRTLTLELVEKCRKEGVDFVFNTPNRKSGAGYLKMGWSSLGRLPLAFRPMLRRGGAASFDASLPGLLSHPALEPLLTCWAGKQTTMRTAVSPSYLGWRYAKNPAIANQYEAVADLDGPAPYVAIVRVKKLLRRLTELRLVDFFAAADFSHADCRSRVQSYAGSRNVDVMTWPAHLSATWPFRGIAGRIGPVVTVRPLNRPELAPADFTAWTPSLGDMELF